MSQTKQKATSVSLTMTSPATIPRQSYSTLIQPLSLDPQRMQSPTTSQTGSTRGIAPVFTKGLQNIMAANGQLVVFECRIRASPTLQVRWYRDYSQIIDSADFRILRKKACLSTAPEEVCTLVITEAFPEDSGIFQCVAENESGAVASSACLFVSQGTREMEEFEAISHLPATMNTATLPSNSQNVVKERDIASNPSYNVLQKTPDPAVQMEHTSPGWQNYQGETEERCSVYENFPETAYPCYPKPMYHKQASTKSVQKTSDQEIQGTKEALIQDLERKLRCKDSLLQNGNQRLTYEERMARRLLGPENAASVFDAQNEENVQNSQQQPTENTRLQVPTGQIRSRPSSRGEEQGQGSIQEKFFQPRFTQVPEDITIEEGRFCRLDFKVSGLPTPDVNWYLNGRLVHPDEFHKMIVSEKGFHSFIFEVIRASDTGTYECVATNRAGEAAFTVKLDVIAKQHQRPPTFIFKPQSKKVYEGDTARLECQISAIPTPRIYWKKNNEMVQFNADRISMLHDTSGRVCLLIHNANKKDAGWYTVSAVNEAGVATCHTRLEVASHPHKPLPNPRKLKVRPTFSKYLALNGRGLDVKQAFSPEGEFQRLAAESGLYESDEL
ncbi:PREDICTED: myotilin isoform X1 [Gavialis gangeticus]|uniref:myotilin isoform X1 n=2 Tax=Gavialis gangeticus TaxID=94835 RepID=UPI00092F4F4C|nr:PREDICTED: myotilin isoform X1 [Gavialis gangeticus]XP_019361770.1 PREDICTED: myotilin isoform X1 [Gavialis gangeticus]